MTKTYRKLYPKLCTSENIEFAFRKARKGKTQKQCVQDFEEKLDENILKLRGELLTGTYSPLPLKTFILRDPKTRKISVSDFRDRVVHHAVCNILEPIFEKYFIHDSYANRKGKGVLAALQRFDRFKRRVSRNGIRVNGAGDDNFVQGFALKADIKHYFDNVDHKKLLEIIRRKIKDDDVLALITKIISNHSGKIPGRGMPLGNLTSQFFANIYLNELDQFVKQELRAKYYIRYVDDFVILYHSKRQLEEWKERINRFLDKELLLELHPQKSKIHPLGRGIDFLGFKCFYHFRILRRRNIVKMLNRINRFKAFLAGKMIQRSEILESLQGWNAYAMHANTYTLRKKITGKVMALIQN